MVSVQTAMRVPRLGDVLVARGHISREALERLAANARGKLGEYLRTHRGVSGRALAEALAEQQGLEFVDFTDAPPDLTLFRPHDAARYMALRYAPYCLQDRLLTVATPEPSVALQQALERHYECRVALVGTGPRDLQDYFTRVAGNAATRRARLGLRRQHPDLVADRVLKPVQLHGLLLMLALAALVMGFAPRWGWHTLLVLCNVFYLLSIAVKIQFYREGMAQRRLQKRQEAKTRRSLEEMAREDLPVYSVLVPLYYESTEVMGRLISALDALDYPREKLDIKFICEADDQGTIAALKALRPPETIELVMVPPSLPRTKPKACNLALQRIRGEFLVIYDAEDLPARDQLKRAVLAFRQNDAKLACVQASLNYYNRDENLLTQLFSIEYSALFRISLPALERMGLPIPLGGTSNHLRVAALEEVGAWDPFNVTEDADLGIRLAYFGYRTANLVSLTREEAPLTLRVWLKQRTRWIKGYIQTWLVYMRHPAELKRRLGPAGYYGFQFFVGAPALTFLLAPMFWAIYIVSLTRLIPPILGPYMEALCGISFVGGMASNLLYARAVLAFEGWGHMRRAMLLYPFYWLLHSVAAGMALWQLAFRPHYWAKTRHGVSKFLLPGIPSARTA